MEILVTVEHNIEFAFSVIAYSLVMLLFTSLGVLYMVEVARNKFKLKNLIGVIFYLCIAIFCSISINILYEEGKRMTYKAKVTDFNEVYDNGYEIVGKEGELHILEKTKK